MTSFYLISNIFSFIVSFQCFDMTRNKCISSVKVSQMVALQATGMTQTAIADYLHLNQSVVQRCLARYHATGSFSHRNPPIRKRVTSRQTDSLIRRLVVQNPTSSSTFIASQLPPSVSVSTRTIRRRLQIDFKLRAYHPACAPLLSHKNIADRLAFAKKYQNWTAEQWCSVMFSDETIIKQFYSCSSHVRRPVGARYNIRYTIPRVKHSPQIMIWGCISAQGTGGLWFMPPNSTITAAVYLEVLQEKLPNLMDAHHCSTFQHDGAPVHSAKIVKAWLSTQGINILGPWPGNSPDLNPIENCWAVMKKKLAKWKPTSLNDLKEKAITVWNQECSAEYCQSLITSMPDRIAAVLAAKGGLTKY
jgi:predicted transcriptional regulator